ncbi:MAG: hypothetical protein IKJ67_01580 [Bacteroidales bacterium]|nr:hypothetical protein [Bacteroidales bacterium]
MEDCNIKKRKILGKGRYLTQYKNILSSMYFDKNEIENGIISLEESDEILEIQSKKRRMSNKKEKHFLFDNKQEQWEFIQNNITEEYPLYVAIWPYSQYCGLFRVNSLSFQNICFPFNLENNGVITFISEYVDIVLDYYKDNLENRCMNIEIYSKK